MISKMFGFGDESGNIMAAVIAGTVAKAVGLSIVARTWKQQFEKIGTVSALYMYPVKSCGVMVEREACCTKLGLSAHGFWDRQRMILTPNNQVLTMKEAPKLTLIKSQSVGDIMRLTAPGMDDLDMPKDPEIKKGKIILKSFEGQIIPVLHCGEEAERWISEYLQRPARIVYSSPELGIRDTYKQARDWDNTAREGDVTLLNYLTSFMMTSTASLKEVNSHLDKDVSMVNFRPNIVIENDIPFDEDNWVEVRIGDKVLFHSVEPCLRCTITTIDPDTASRDSERQPWEYLRRTRCRPPYGKTSPVFGLYVSLDVAGQVQVGDPVYVIRRQK